MFRIDDSDADVRAHSHISFNTYNNLEKNRYCAISGVQFYFVLKFVNILMTETGIITILGNSL